ncbi:MAG: hypothetical protein E7213_00005 [Clostridium sp.]|nr:hypothetical protein [Clostridium sp.]
MYSFREIVFENGDKELVIDFNEANKEMLTVFLCTEVEDFTEEVIEKIDEVLNKESEYEEFVGNICSVEIDNNKTKISDIFDMNVPCEIETKELRNLIDIWLKKLDEFNKTGEI